MIGNQNYYFTFPLLVPPQPTVWAPYHQFGNVWDHNKLCSKGNILAMINKLASSPYKDSYPTSKYSILFLQFCGSMKKACQINLALFDAFQYFLLSIVNIHLHSFVLHYHCFIHEWCIWLLEISSYITVASSCNWIASYCSITLYSIIAIMKLCIS